MSLYLLGLAVISGLILFLIFYVKNGTYNLSIVNIFLLFEYLSFSIFFFYLLDNKLVKKIILISIPLFFIFTIYTFLRSKLNTYNPQPFMVEFLAFMIVILFYFYEKMLKVSVVPIYKTISFWICVAFFIYFTGSFFYFLLANSSKDSVFVRQMKQIFSSVSIVKDIILCLAWFAHEPTGKEPIINVPEGLGLDDDLPFLKNTNV